jgi:plastocyanin
VHSAATLLSPVLAAEKSKVPFYIAGGALATWAVIVSVGLGLRKPSFPGNLLGERVVLAITGVLVVGAVSMAVLTSGSPAKGSPAKGSPAKGSPAKGSPGSPANAPPAKAGAPSAPGSAVSSALSLAANPGGVLSYNSKRLSAKAGTVTIAFTNAAPLEHNLTIAEGSKVLGATPTFVSGSRTLRLTLKPGTYTFYCTVPGHRQAGMEGTLNVT